MTRPAPWLGLVILAALTAAPSAAALGGLVGVAVGGVDAASGPGLHVDVSAPLLGRTSVDVGDRQPCDEPQQLLRVEVDTHTGTAPDPCPLDTAASPTEPGASADLGPDTGPSNDLGEGLQGSDMDAGPAGSGADGWPWLPAALILGALAVLLVTALVVCRRRRGADRSGH